MKRRRTLGSMLALPAAGLALVGCGSATSATDTSGKPARASAASGNLTSASPTASGPDAALHWCKAYTEITGALSSAQPTVTGAQTALNALQSFDQLWAAGANLGYVTKDESEANRRAIVAYSHVMKLVADGKKPDSTEVSAAGKALTSGTTKDQELLRSSAGKVQTLCAPIASPPPSSSATHTP